MPKSKEMISDSDSGSVEYTVEEDGEEKVPIEKRPKKPAMKRKQDSSDSESVSEEEVKQKRKPKKVEKKKQESSGSESDDDSVSKKRPAKGKVDDAPKKKTKTEGSMQKNNQGEVFWDLGATKRITVRSFKGKLLIDIREFYDDDGQMKPGKKGIALQVANWNALKSVFDEVDNYVKSQ